MVENKNVVILFYPFIGPRHTSIPFTLLYLERMIRDLDVELILIDENKEADYLPIITKVKDRILLVGASAMIGHQISGAIKFSKEIRKITDALVIWGGWYPSLCPEQVLQEDFVDLVCMDQGEVPFRSLVQKLLNGQDISKIEGIGYKKNGEQIICKNDAKYANSYSFPQIDYTLVNLNKYTDHGTTLRYIASSGCPYDCAFCTMVVSYGRRWFANSVENVINDLLYFKKETNFTHLEFYDDNFFINKKWILDFCEAMIKAELNLEWLANAHAGHFRKFFKDEELELIYRAGCRRISFGAESGEQDVLDLISKQTSVDDNYNMAKILKPHNIKVTFNAMLCLPENPNRDFQSTLTMLGKAKLINNTIDMQAYFYVPLPRTELFDLAVKHGWKQPSTMAEMVIFTGTEYSAPWWTKNFRKELEYFELFFFRFANPKDYEYSPKEIRLVVYLFNKLFYPIIYLRFMFGFRKFPVEAWLFLKLNNMYKKLNGIQKPADLSLFATELGQQEALETKPS